MDADLCHLRVPSRIESRSPRPILRPHQPCDRNSGEPLQRSILHPFFVLSTPRNQIGLKSSCPGLAQVSGQAASSLNGLKDWKTSPQGRDCTISGWGRPEGPNPFSPYGMAALRPVAKTMAENRLPPSGNPSTQMHTRLRNCVAFIGGWKATRPRPSFGNGVGRPSRCPRHAGNAPGTPCDAASARSPVAPRKTTEVNLSIHLQKQACAPF
jgi:hypothetical protein